MSRARPLPASGLYGRPKLRGGLSQQGEVPTLGTESEQVWRPSTYVLWVGGVGVLGAVVVWIGSLFGAGAAAAVVAAVPLLILVVLKPEIGVFLIILYEPFERLTPILPGAVTVTKVLGVATLGMVLMHSARRRQIDVKSRALWLAFAFALWSMFTMFASRLPGLAMWRAASRFMMVGLVFVVINAVYTRRQRDALFLFVFLAGVGAGFAGFFLTTTGRVAIGERANLLARTLQGSLFVLPWLWSRARMVWKPLMILGFGIILAAIVGSGSRSSYVAAAVGVMAAVMAYGRVSLPVRTLLLIGVLGCFAIGLALVAATGVVDMAYIGERLTELQEEGLNVGRRWPSWRAAVHLGVNNPLMGVGVGNFRLASMGVVRFGMAVHNDAHNDFLTHFAETGVPGLLLYTAFVGVVFWRVVRVRNQLLRACLMGVFVSAQVGSLAIPAFPIKTYWIQMGLCLVGAYIDEPPSERTARPRRLPAWPADGGLLPGAARARAAT